MGRIAVTSKTGMTGYVFIAETKTLEISFKGKKEGDEDRVYHYAPFTSEQFEAFVMAESLGSHFLKVIKPRVGKDLTCTKIEPDPPGQPAAKTE
jgi:hypothetical protein